jgi:hypothetical protein
MVGVDASPVGDASTANALITTARWRWSGAAAALARSVDPGRHGSG